MTFANGDPTILQSVIPERILWNNNFEKNNRRQKNHGKSGSMKNMVYTIYFKKNLCSKSTFLLLRTDTFASTVVIYIPPPFPPPPPPPQKKFVCGGYTVFTLSVCVPVHNVLFPLYLEESLLDFHQTLQTCSYMQDKYLSQKSMGWGPILLRVISLCSSKWLLIKGFMLMLS